MVALRRPDELPPPEEDGLPVRAIKAHTRDKLHFWGCYLEAASTATKRVFAGARVCADLFCGPGVCADATTGARVWGSCLLSLQVAAPFETYFFNDNDPYATAALAERARRIGIQGAAVLTLDLTEPTWRLRARDIAEARTLAGPKVVVSTGDANQAHAALKIIAPRGRRYVCAVIDPQSAIFAWEAFEALALDEHAMDVLVLFPDAMDVGRGLSAYLRNGTKLDRYYDPNADWRRVAKESPHPASALRALYERRMRELIGFEVGRPRTVVRAGTKDGALYRLIYGSRSKKGIAIWDDIARRSRDEQIEMYLPDV